MEAKTAHVDLSFHINLPRNINISNLTQNEIQEAFREPLLILDERIS